MKNTKQTAYVKAEFTNESIESLSISKHGLMVTWKNGLIDYPANPKEWLKENVKDHLFFATLIGLFD